MYKQIFVRLLPKHRGAISRRTSWRGLGSVFTRRAALGAPVCLLILMAIASCGAQAPKDTRPIAEVGGKPIYEQDIASKVDDQLSQLAHEEYEVKKKALESYIDDELLAQQAQAQHLTADALLARDVDSKVPEPTDQQIQTLYAAEPNLQGHPFDQIKDRLRRALYQSEVQTARQEYLENLRKQADVQIFLQPPPVQISFDPRRVRGGADAPVVIVEFADFQCPFCRGAESTLRQLLANYPGRVSLAYRDFPLSEIHPLAEKAAEASRCAEDQGKFWPYHDLLMSNPPRLDPSSLLADAGSLGLDQKQFSVCLSSGKYKSAVELDRDAGVSLGVQGTPTFFINGTEVSGAQPVAVFESAIDKQLASAVKAGKAGK